MYKGNAMVLQCSKWNIHALIASCSLLLSVFLSLHFLSFLHFASCHSDTVILLCSCLWLRAARSAVQQAQREVLANTVVMAFGQAEGLRVSPWCLRTSLASIMYFQLPPCWKVQVLQITTKRINANANTIVAHCQGAEIFQSSRVLLVCHLTLTYRNIAILNTSDSFTGKCVISE